MVAVDPPFDELTTYFDRPIAEAALELGVCGARLKQIIRDNGVGRWPFRKYQALLSKGIVSTLDEFLYGPGGLLAEDGEAASGGGVLAALGNHSRNRCAACAPGPRAESKRPRGRSADPHVNARARARALQNRRAPINTPPSQATPPAGRGDALRRRWRRARRPGIRARREACQGGRRRCGGGEREGARQRSPVACAGVWAQHLRACPPDPATDARLCPRTRALSPSPSRSLARSRARARARAAGGPRAAARSWRGRRHSRRALRAGGLARGCDARGSRAWRCGCARASLARTRGCGHACRLRRELLG